MPAWPVAYGLANLTTNLKAESGDGDIGSTATTRKLRWHIGHRNTNIEGWRDRRGRRLLEALALAASAAAGEAYGENAAISLG